MPVPRTTAQKISQGDELETVVAGLGHAVAFRIGVVRAAARLGLRLVQEVVEVGQDLVQHADCRIVRSGVVEQDAAARGRNRGALREDRAIIDLRFSIKWAEMGQLPHHRRVDAVRPRRHGLARPR
ncbi:hypothetical protein [Streptomyces canus]|uniref:hypothetical protein n=1 Tax=Streptomyces canus TaxID=58343 RepID=UPI0036EB39DD